MRFWGVVSTIAMGFLMGLVLAGVGGISAGIKASVVEKRLKSDRIEDYWGTTKLDLEQVEKFIDNQKCSTSGKYFLACVNGVINILEKTNYRLTLSAEVQPAQRKTVQFDNFNERENLVGFNQIYNEGLASTFDFEKLIEKAVKLNSEEPVQFSYALAINGFLSIYRDPHTYILPIAYFNEVTSSSDRSPYFVGVSLEKRMGRVFVRKIFKNSDADQAGLAIGDRILSINGQSLEAKTLSDISILLRSKDFRAFNFVIEREGSQVLKIVQRSYRVLNQVSSEVIENGRIGVIQISKFSLDTCGQVRGILNTFNEDQIPYVILDMRDNPGGRLSEAACLAGLFLGPSQVVYRVKYFDPIAQNEVVLSTGSKIYSGALVVLQNNNSASASELLAGALQEHQRAVVIGQRSFGKGTFQEIEDWTNDEGIKLFRTRGFYLLPSGETTQLSGLAPDFYVPSLPQTASEQMNYFNPISPEFYGLRSHRLSRQLPVSECQVSHSLKPNQNLDKVTLDLSQDQYIAVAKQIVRCPQVMSEIANRFAEEQLLKDLNQ